MLALRIPPLSKQISLTSLDCFYEQIPMNAPISPCSVLQVFRSFVNCGAVQLRVTEVPWSQFLAYGVVG